MKRLLFSISTLFLLASLRAQAPLYLLFTQDCVDQLEYRYTYGGATVLGYSMHPRPNEQYLLTAGATGISSPTLPDGTITCRDFNMNETFMDAINRATRQVYMVHQTPNGYMLMPLIGATQVMRYGAVYQFRTPNYGFALDTNNLVYEQNIAAPNSDSYVYFSGLKIHNCRYEYSFRRVPTQADLDRSDFDFIPGIGLVSDRSGKSATEAENNQVRLVKVNGVSLDDYLAVLCKDGSVAPTSSVTKWTPPAQYSTNNPVAPDKETASILQNNAAAPAQYNSPGSPRPLINCPDAPGYGYHVVQPGESLNAIARTYNVEVKNLVKWNKIKNPDFVEACQKIWLMTPPAGAALSSKVTTKPAEYNYKQPGAGPTVANQSVYWNQAAPAVNPAPNPYSTNYAPAQYNTQPPVQTTPKQVAPVRATTMLHTVQKGETISGIARKYGFTEERLRQMNNLPPTGDVVIYPGQQFTVDCSNSGGAYYNPNPTEYNYNSYSNPATMPAQYNTNPTPASPPYNGNTTQPGSFLWRATEAQPSAPAQYNTTTYPGDVQPNTDYREPFTETPVSGGNNAYQQSNKSGMPAPPTVPKVEYYQEYVVRQGENLRSIAIKNNMSVSELALINGLQESESVMPGKRLLIPKI